MATKYSASPGSGSPKTMMPPAIVAMFAAVPVIAIAAVLGAAALREVIVEAVEVIDELVLRRERQRVPPLHRDR